MTYIKHHFGSNRGFLRYYKYSLLQTLFGRFSAYKKIPSSVDRVVFVCKGNICRSPLAEKVFQEVSTIETASFGLDTHSGYPAHPSIVKASNHQGYDLSDHQTTALEHFSPRDKDLYICTEPEHAQLLQNVIKAPNVLLLGFFGDKTRVYIHDPYSAPEGYANIIVNFIIKATKNLAQKIESKVSTP